MVSIVIQSGGQSTRMGEEKGLVPFCGKPLIQNVLERVQHIGDEIIIVTNKPDLYNFLKVKSVNDIYQNYGALAGLHSGLTNAKHNIVVNLACDIPYVNSELLSYLIEKMKKQPDRDVIIPKTEMGYEPMQAVYRRKTCLPAVEAAIREKKRRMISWFDQVNVMEIEETTLRTFNQDLENFINMNTKNELQMAENTFGCINKDN
ncbi:MAG: hypothetical protein CL609_13640 [Anaerolineaceae bacterium]|nr:hypothetical protein [Anaerolineaceae bacterium]